jgi:GIY-YIG catalytic domain
MKTNKELKEEYKQKKFRAGVFQIRNTLNNRIFIGSSTNLDLIFNRHKLQLNYGNHPNSELQKDWKKLGEVQFSYEILSEIEQTDDSVDYDREAELLKEMYLGELEPFGEKGYNKKSPRKI